MTQTSAPATPGDPAGDPTEAPRRATVPVTASTFVSGVWNRRGDWAGPVAVFVIVFIGYVLFAAQQWAHFTARSWDLGIFTQLLAHYAALQPPIVDIKGDGYNLLGDHFHPLLAILAPVYALFPSAFTLLVIQAACFAFSAAVFTRAAVTRLGTVAGVALGFAFGFAWGLQYAADAQFHEIALAVPLLTLSLIAVLDRRWAAATSWGAPLVFVKEDLGLTVVMLGLVIALLAWRERPGHSEQVVAATAPRSPSGAHANPPHGDAAPARAVLQGLGRLSGVSLGAGLAVWGVVWFVIATMIVLPALNPGGEWAYADKADPLSVLTDTAILFNPAKGETIALLLASSAVLVLRSPLALLLLPTLAWRFLSTNSGYWAPTWHYSAVLIPIVLVALLDAIERGRESRWMRMRAYVRHAPAIAVTAAIVLLPGLPLFSLVTAESWEPSPRASSAQAAIAAVPAGASVVSDIGLMNYLVSDHDVYWIGNANPEPDCIVIDTVAGGTPGEWGSVIDVGQRLFPGVGYAAVFDRDGYQVACR
ncbi:putative membrane protein [Microbacterium sp. SORGH_AS 1204]|uniref:DUF2079 domain-containing protein n=1 Tax=Microbacterium sp. SORGH_AS_1204 TaxID=3041785 RepID=UPI0027944858|nr:DUF2079 domain-containing protein [Microbacterium sp. SORGH_AS_1204]MDQ1135604.1 putative membrane protein [Microbacterium sp. SORGH_AS_1204]